MTAWAKLEAFQSFLIISFLISAGVRAPRFSVPAAAVIL